MIGIDSQYMAANTYDCNSKKLNPVVSGGIIIGRSMRRSMHRMNDCQANNYQRYSFLLHIRRWITELWNNVIKRFKNIFQEARRLEMLRSYAARSASPVLVSTSNRVLNTDSEQEKTFWREGRPSKSEKRSSTFIIYSKARTTKNYCTSSTKSKDLDCMQRMTSNCMIHEKFINDQRNINSTKGTESSLSSRLDDEYDALYRKRSSIHDEHLSRELTSEMYIKSNNPNGDCSLETPIDNSVSRVQGKTTNCERKESESGNGESEKSHTNIMHLKDQSDCSTIDNGKWIQTVCFGSVWYSKSELNMSAGYKSNRRRKQASRIPRLLNSPRKRHISKN